VPWEAALAETKVLVSMAVLGSDRPPISWIKPFNLSKNHPQDGGWFFI
jgi:hypothetical protein